MTSNKFLLASFLLSLTMLNACKDKSKDSTSNPCDSKNILITTTITQASKCVNNGKISVNASGSSGFTYQLNNGTFQSDTVFSSLSAGTYTITAKDKDGCTQTRDNIIISENGTKGPLFSAVTALITSKCNGAFCHGTGAGGAPIGKMDTDCKIAELGPTIKIKAVDEGMGSLSLNDKNKITNWINAGGKTTD